MLLINYAAPQQETWPCLARVQHLVYIVHSQCIDKRIFSTPIKINELLKKNTSMNTIIKKCALLTGLLLPVALKAQPWVTIFAPPPAVPFNLRAYNTYYLPFPTAMDQMERNISDATAALRTLRPDSASLSSTGFFVKTDEKKPYLCLVTAAHSFMSNNTPTPRTVFLEAIGYKYRRMQREQFGINPTAAVEYSIRASSTYTVLAAGLSSINNICEDDYAIIAIPKWEVPPGVRVFELPYQFIAGDLAVPATAAEKLIMIHHSLGLPQRISELWNDYPDVTRNQHRIVQSGINNKFWTIGYWNNGSISTGASGAALISTKNGQPTAIGINTNSIQLSGFDSPAILFAAQNDYGKWKSAAYKLSNIASVIREKCGCTDSAAATGRGYVPVKLDAPTSVSLFSQRDLELASIVFGAENPATATWYYNHTGNITITAALKDIRANIHAWQGAVILKPGFDASASNGAELVIGTGSFYVSGSASPLVGKHGTITGFEAAIDTKATTVAAEGSLKTQQLFKVYPSPTKGIINIAPGLNGKAYTIRITDILGKEIFKENTAAPGNRQIDISSKITAGGTYLLQVQVKGEASPVVWKMVIMK